MAESAALPDMSERSAARLWNYDKAWLFAELLGHCLADLRANRPVRLPQGVSPAPTSPAPLIPVSMLAGNTSPAGHVQDRRRRWATVAASLLFLVCALGVSEATGVTDLTDTVIRLTAGSGKQHGIERRRTEVTENA